MIITYSMHRTVGMVVDHSAERRGAAEQAQKGCRVTFTQCPWGSYHNTRIFGLVRYSLRASIVLISMTLYKRWFKVQRQCSSDQICLFLDLIFRLVTYLCLYIVYYNMYVYVQHNEHMIYHEKPNTTTEGDLNL